jgi:putative aldouronate transport system permease protein
MIVSMYFSGGIIPYYVLLRQLHLINTFWVYVIPGMLNCFFVLVAISFFQNIPVELYESAYLDGANYWTIYARIILPVSKPILATIGLFIAVGQWNNWVDSAFFVTQRPELRTLSYLMMEVITKSQVQSSANAVTGGYRTGSSVNPQSIQMTAMIISVVPIMCVYPFLQKYFVKGVMLGSVKG